jgi:hypothetical protein
MNPGSGLVGLAVFTVIAVSVLIAPVHEVEEVETHYTREPLTYEQTFARESQVRRFCFPWFCDKTQVQYGLRNTDDSLGEFPVNFIFDNGSDRATKTETTTIIAGEEVAVTVVSPLKGQSGFTINVIPPAKRVSHEWTVTKKVSTLSKLGELQQLGFLR